MKTNFSSLSAVLVAVFAFNAAASAQGFTERASNPNSPEFTAYEKKLASSDPDYFTINKKSIKLTLLAVGDEQYVNYVTLQEAPPKDLPGVLVSIDSIINIASKVWKIVEANAPVVNVDTKYATAYPQGITSAAQLAQWSRPKSYTYAFYAENLYGSVMIDCKYKVSFTYNGAYKGKGKFLTGVAVIPTTITAGWGYKFFMTAAVPDSTIANVGTDTDPIAAMQMKLSWIMKTVLKEVDGTSVYYVQGDGYFEEIASPWKQGPKAENMKSAAPLLEAGNIF
jgi:hypothetical protein